MGFVLAQTVCSLTEQHMASTIYVMKYKLAIIQRTPTFMLCSHLLVTMLMSKQCRQWSSPLQRMTMFNTPVSSLRRSFNRKPPLFWVKYLPLHHFQPKVRCSNEKLHQKLSTGFACQKAMNESKIFKNASLKSELTSKLTKVLQEMRMVDNLPRPSSKEESRVWRI